MGPQAIEVGTQPLDACEVELVQAPVARRTINDELRTLQYPEMLRDRRPADWKVAGQVADGAGALEQALEDRAASGVPQCVPFPIFLNFP